MKRAMLTGFAAAVVVLGFALGWASLRRADEIERQMRQEKIQAEVLRQQTRAYGRRLEEALQVASAARDKAERASASAAEAASGRAVAEASAQAADAAKRHAEDQTRESTKELAAIRQTRLEELSRMQNALTRIALTRRTESGFVIDLTNDSFHFDFDKVTLRPENRELLSRIAGVLLVSNGYRLFVHGYTDDVGTDRYNQSLSERRAESVASYLISAGVDPDIIETHGFGKSTPRAEGATSAARHQNRRVELVVVDSILKFPPADSGGGKS